MAGGLDYAIAYRLCYSACDECNAFFFQAEDGIRDYKVTGVQTCALPISANGPCLARLDRGAPARRRARVPHAAGARDVPREPRGDRAGHRRPRAATRAAAGGPVGRPSDARGDDGATQAVRGGPERAHGWRPDGATHPAGPGPRAPALPGRRPVAPRRCRRRPRSRARRPRLTPGSESPRFERGLRPRNLSWGWLGGGRRGPLR